MEDIHARLEDNVLVSEAAIDEETIIATPVNEKKPLDETKENASKKELQSQLLSDKKGKSKKGILALSIIALIGILIVGLTWNKLLPSSSDQEITNHEKKDSLVDVSNVLDLIVKSPLGEYKYIGTVNEQNLPDGWGEAIFSDGRTYRGNFTKGNLTGPNAFFRYPNGDVFEGTFKDNSFHEGKYTIAEDGSYFIGTFKNGQPNKGIWYNKNGKTL